MAKATAGAITRLLKTEGFTKAEWRRSGRIKGWGESSAGFEPQQQGDVVEVAWNHGSFRRMSSEQRAELDREKLTALTLALERKGYVVELVDGRWSLVLRVTKP